MEMKRIPGQDDITEALNRFKEGGGGVKKLDDQVVASDRKAETRYHFGEGDGMVRNTVSALTKRAKQRRQNQREMYKDIGPERAGFRDMVISKRLRRQEREAEFRKHQRLKNLTRTF